MLVTDLDGTLLRTDKTISAYTASVFRRCRERGMKIVFATGRPERNMTQVAQVIPPDAVISDNGARACAGGRAIFQRDIPPGAVIDIVETLRPLEGIRLHVNYGSNSFTNHETWQTWGSWGVEFSDFTTYEPCGVRKIAIEAQELSLLSNVDFDALGCHFTGNQGEKWYLVTEKSAAKVNAIEAVAAHFGIAMGDIAAFGDDHNDIGMLRACGVGVAVANAIDGAKAAADFICGSNDDDGPARWIETNLL
ncbi:MAG: HAD family hydrolase [Oscillospiraceae bacterium]|nr:HAD family hydrolase [Oscillospiraceae bacterium]